MKLVRPARGKPLKWRHVIAAIEHLSGGSAGHVTWHYDTADSRDYAEATGDHGATGAHILKRLRKAGVLPLSLEVDGRAWTIRVPVSQLVGRSLASCVSVTGEAGRAQRAEQAPGFAS